MRRICFAIIVLFSVGQRLSAQGIDDLNIQLHGYATQGFIYSNHNNWNTTDSSSGSAAWTEAVLNVSAQPDRKLSIGMQARYFLLGDYGNNITLDWAQADYKFNDRIGFRVGKVKTPSGLLNEVQDIDPAHLWVLLPQSTYPIASRNSILSHYGGVAYGRILLGESFGKLEYRAFGGERSVSSNDPYLAQFRDQGITLYDGLSGHTAGGTLRWLTPLRGLIFGATEQSGTISGPAQVGPYAGVFSAPQLRQTYFFGKFERERWMVAAEVSRFEANTRLGLTGLPAVSQPIDWRPFYVMASWKATGKLTGGLYYSSLIDHRAAFTSSRYEKDWALAGRYDFNPYLYGKLEQHWIDGTEVGFNSSDNQNLQPTTRMTLLKLGVTF